MKTTITVFTFLLIYIFSPPTIVHSAVEITSTDVFYLAKAIDDSLVEMHNLYTTFHKGRLTNNSKISNNFQRAVLLAEEFNYLHPKFLGRAPIDKKILLDIKENAGAEHINSKDVYNVLLLIKDVLLSRNQFIEYRGEKTGKTPSDVYQMIRQISHHHREIYNKKNTLPWNKPERVYEANFFEVYPLLIKIVKEEGGDPEQFSFPLKPAKGMKPKDVYKSQVYLHVLLEKYYASRRPGYIPIHLSQATYGSEIDPGDVFDLTQIIIAELKNIFGNPEKFDRQTLARYYNWKNDKRYIVPGDVYNLVQHNISLLKSLDLN